MSGCSDDCGRKGGCDSRKAGMFGAIDETLALLYPTRRWDERDDEAAFGAGVPAATSHDLAQDVARRLSALTLFRPGGPGDLCDYLYVLCFGRAPSILEIREGVARADALGGGELCSPEPVAGGHGNPPRVPISIEELHLRVALSAVAPFAAVQQVALSLRRTGRELVVTETPRTGVFDPVLLPRFRKLVTALAERDIRHLDFGDMTVPPAGFDAGAYGDRYGGAPTIANYLFFPHPASAVTTTVIPVGSP